MEMDVQTEFNFHAELQEAFETWRALISTCEKIRDDHGYKEDWDFARGIALGAIGILGYGEICQLFEAAGEAVSRISPVSSDIAEFAPFTGDTVIAPTGCEVISKCGQRLAWLFFENDFAGTKLALVQSHWDYLEFRRIDSRVTREIRQILAASPVREQTLKPEPTLTVSREEFRLLTGEDNGRGMASRSTINKLPRQAMDAGIVGVFGQNKWPYLELAKFFNAGDRRFTVPATEQEARQKLERLKFLR